MKLLGLFCRSREFRQRLERSRSRLYRVAYSWCHDPDLAEDLVQETQTKALRLGHQLREPEAMNTWMFRILSNCWRDHLRRNRDTVEFDEGQHQHPMTPESLHAQQQTVNNVRNAIARLPEGQRQVITLVDLEGCSYVEVAEILDVPMGTVMSRLCRARRALSDQLLRAGVVNTEPRERIRRVK